MIIGPAKYNDCVFNCESKMVGIISTERAPFIMNNSSINAYRIEKPTIVSFYPYVQLSKSSLTINGDYLRLKVGRIQNNTIMISNNVNPVSFYLSPEGGVINDNTFVIAGQHNTIISVSSDQQSKLNVSNNEFQFTRKLNNSPILFSINPKIVGNYSNNILVFKNGRSLGKTVQEVKNSGTRFTISPSK